MFFGPTAYVCGTARSTIGFPCNYQHNTTVVGDFNGDGLPDLVAGVFIPGGTSFNFHDVGEVDVLLNDSPGNGFTATGISSATDTWTVGAGSIVSAYGANLAPTTEAATVNAAPTTLGGIRLHVRDRSHTGDGLAPLLYVSPTQINYVLNSSDPYAWVDVERVGGAAYVPQEMTVPISALAPGFYALAGGVAAASAVTVTPYAVVPVSVTPIDLSGGPVYLSVYGTGFAQAAASASGCTVGGVGVPVSYAGPEIAIAGLDQVNLLLPKSLAGSGVGPVACTFQTAPGVTGSTNAVNVAIR